MSGDSVIFGKIGEEYGDWLTRVQVIKKKGQHRFVAWMTVKGDRIYEFVEFFNKQKRTSNTTDASNRKKGGRPCHEEHVSGRHQEATGT